MARSVLAILALSALLCAAEPAELTVPASTEVVIDRAGVIDALTRARITALLLRLRQATTAEVKVLAVASTGDEDIVGFAQRHFELWRLGQHGKDNGALLVLASADHHVRIHTGYGLEAVLPDAWCGSLSRAVAGSDFKAGRYAAGLERMTRAVAAEIAAAAHVDLGDQTGARYAPTPPAQGIDLGTIVVLVVIALVILQAWRNRDSSRSVSRRSSWPGWYGGFGGGSTGGGGFGGGFSGGSSGFSGGGGHSGGGGGGASW